MKRLNPSLVFFIGFALLFSCYYCNAWHLAGSRWFTNFQADSQELVIYRLMVSHQQGIFADYGSLERYRDGYGYSLQALPEYYAGDYRAPLKTYQSQIGIQGMCFSLLAAVLPCSNALKIQLFYILTTICMVITLLFLILWMYHEFGPRAAVFAFASLLFAPWLIVMSRNLYWVFWIMFLPMMIVLYGVRAEDQTGRYSYYGQALLIFLTVFLKCSAGYEYLSSVLVASLLPVIYYAMSRRWARRKFLTRVALILSCGIAAFLVAVCVQSCQRGLLLHSTWVAGLTHILFDAAKRTYGHPADFPPELQASLRASVLIVLKKYFISFMLIYLVALGLFTNLHLRFFRQHTRLHALCVTCWVSLLAPISWFTLAKGHSYIHTHINFILWYLPCIILIACFLGYFSQTILQAEHIESCHVPDSRMLKVAPAIAILLCLLLTCIIPR